MQPTGQVELTGLSIQQLVLYPTTLSNLSSSEMFSKNTVSILKWKRVGSIKVL
jgi:hypothetical protein